MIKKILYDKFMELKKIIREHYKKILVSLLVLVSFAMFSIFEHAIISFISLILMSGSFFYISHLMYQHNNLFIYEKFQQIDENILENGPDFETQQDLDKYIKKKEKEKKRIKRERNMLLISTLVMASLSFLSAVTILIF